MPVPQLWPPQAWEASSQQQRSLHSGLSSSQRTSLICRDPGTGPTGGNWMQRGLHLGSCVQRAPHSCRFVPEVPHPWHKAGHRDSYFHQKQPLRWTLLPDSAAPCPLGTLSLDGNEERLQAPPVPPVVPGRLGEVDGLLLHIHRDARHQLLQHHRANHGHHPDVLPARHAAHQPQARECRCLPSLPSPQGLGQE